MKTQLLGVTSKTDKTTAILKPASTLRNWFVEMGVWGEFRGVNTNAVWDLPMTEIVQGRLQTPFGIATNRLDLALAIGANIYPIVERCDNVLRLGEKTRLFAESVLAWHHVAGTPFCHSVLAQPAWHFRDEWAFQNLLFDEASESSFVTLPGTNESLREAVKRWWALHKPSPPPPPDPLAPAVCKDENGYSVLFPEVGYEIRLSPTSRADRPPPPLETDDEQLDG